MKFTQSWLKQFLDTDIGVTDLVRSLTEIGIEVEKVIDKSPELAPFITAEITAIRKHPDADKLNLCTVNYGTGINEIVCGASNVRVGLKVVLAPLGTLIPTSKIVIEKRKIRGIESVGMLCSAAELGINEDSDGIIELPETTKVGERLLDALAELSDPLIEVEITPNRSDCLGIYGLARDAAAYGIGELKKLNYSSVSSAIKNPIHIIIEAEAECPLFITRYFSNVTNGDSNTKLQSLLRFIGEEPITAAVDITNYINYSFGRPMHVYDADKIDGKLYITTLESNATFYGLDGKEYSLETGDLVIRDDEKICCIAGILGGENTKCTSETQNILLEAAVFDPITIAKTARRLGLDTRAKYVFERGVDHNFTSTAVDIASDMLIKACGGLVSEKKIMGKEKIPSIKLKFHLEKIEKITGVNLPNKIITEILEKLGFDIEILSNEVIQVTVPSWRHDITIEEDLVEEIIRIHGFHNIKEKTMPAVASFDKGKFGSRTRLLTEARSVLCSSGYYELITWSFMSSEIAKKFGIYDESLLLANPISEDLDIMRKSILPNLLSTVQKNNARSLDNLSFFEIGPVYGSEFVGRQLEVISGILSGQAVPRSIYQDSRNVDFFDAKRSVIDTLSLFGITELELNFSRDNIPAWYHPGKSSVVKLKNKEIAYLGELHPSILKIMKISKPTIGFEIFVDNLFTHTPKYTEKTISEYQPVSRDFAFILDTKISADSLLKGVATINSDIIRNVSIFDVYEGENVGDLKKSVAINVIMQSDNATLTEKDITDLSEQIISYIAKTLGGTIRKG